jgi:hypothetical protein
MKRTLTALVAAATLVGAATVAPGSAEARYYGHRHGGWGGGGAVAAGVIGGLALGGLAAGAYGGGPYYGGYYAAPAAVYGPPCYWQRQRVWDGYGWRVQRVRVCY